MSVKVRLQGLPPLADSIHIRSFFNGLKIPSGGVTIIGGEYGEAFVTFKNFHDACLALKWSGRPLMNSCVQVFLFNKREQSHKRRHRSMEKPGYVRISLHPFDASFSDVKTFFKHCSVKSVIFLTKNKVRNGQALVKFSKRSHAVNALYCTLSNGEGAKKQHKHEKCFSVISVKKSDEAEWIKFGGSVDPRGKGSTRLSCSTSEPPYDTLYIHEFYAHLMNVSRHAEKRHIRRFLYNLVDDSQITFVYDKNGCRTRDCFVMFVTDNDYTRALGLDKSILKGRPVRVVPVAKTKVMEVVESRKMDITEDPFSEDDFVSEEDSPSPSSSGSKLTCVYLRNFTADVTKHDIKNFFAGFALNEEDIYVLYDDNGNGLGEALAKFSSEEEAAAAENLNRKLFQGTEILLRCISEEQLKVFGVNNFGSSSFDSLDFSTGKEECQLEDLQACVSIADDTPDVTCDSS